MNPSVIVHGTYGLTELYVRAVLAAGFARSDVLCVITQPQEGRNAERLLPGCQVITNGVRPRGGRMYWSGIGPTETLLEASKAMDHDVSSYLLSDRHLRRFPVDTALAWLNQTASRYAQLLDSARPALIVGEVSNASEVLLSAVAKGRGVRYVTPATLRIPSDRFGLWEGPGATQLWARPGTVRPDADRRVEGAQKPFYFNSNNRAPSVFSTRTLGVLASRARDLPDLHTYAMQQPRLGDYVSAPWLNRFRKAAYIREVAKRAWASVPRAPYAFFPLHVQPEASIDWFGNDWRNQLDLAEFLGSRLAEAGMQLVVKDHSNFLWLRGRWFHDRLAALPNVVLVDPAHDGLEIAADAQFTFTVSGTIGLECGLRGLPVVTVADLPWSVLPTVVRVRDRLDLERYIRLGDWTLRQDPESVEQWAQQYSNSGWAGLIANRYAFPAVLERPNVEQLGGALAQLLSASPAA